MPRKGRITEWSRERGLGYLECDGTRIFLHWREFRERHKRPEVGDVIFFEDGQDQQGRTCAKNAFHANDGGRLRPWHPLLLAALLLLPGFAVYRVLGAPGLLYAGGWVLLISSLTFVIYAWDKRRARNQGQREPESQLHLLELVGGWPGAFLAQRLLRHKCSKGPFQFIFILIVGLHQFLAIDALRGWGFVRLCFSLVWKR